MHTYKLVYEDDRHGVAKRIEFEARNATGALSIAGKEARGRWAQLFEGDRFICRLERIDPDGANIWIVANRAEPPRETVEVANLDAEDAASADDPAEGVPPPGAIAVEPPKMTA